MLRIIQNRKYNYFISGITFLLSIIFLIIFGLKPGIDFTGGALSEMEFKTNRPTNEQIKDSLKDLNLEGEIRVQPTGDKGVIIRLKDMNEETHAKMALLMNENFGQDGNDIIEKRFESIGPSIGKELRTKAIYAVILVLIGICLYVAWAFRKVSRPVQSWKYGVVAIIALFHDVIITMGVFSVLGRFYGVEVDSSFIAALLTILGYSVNDTIVVFDRIRENLFRSKKEEFVDIINNSINQTMARSINTTLTTLFALIAVYFFGGESTKYFALALIIGIFCGAYSSIFVASPLLLDWQLLAKKFKR